jgi:large subunit ribosomal protein L16
MLEPKRLIHRRQHRRRGAFYGTAQSGTQLAFGSFALKAIENGEVTARQLEAARKVIARSTQRAGKIWIRIFPHTPVTKKAAEVPMGSGKGSPEYYCAIVQRGTVLFEMDGIPEAIAREALEQASYKLPIKTKILTRLSAPTASTPAA